MHFDEIQETIVSGFVLGEFSLVRNSDGLPSAGRDAAGSVGYVGIAVIEMKETRCEANRQIRCCHLIVG